MILKKAVLFPRRKLNDIPPMLCQLAGQVLGRRKAKRVEDDGFLHPMPLNDPDSEAMRSQERCRGIQWATYE